MDLDDDQPCNKVNDPVTDAFYVDVVEMAGC